MLQTQYELMSCGNKVQSNLSNIDAKGTEQIKCPYYIS